MIFVDTGAWIALLNQRDQHHHDAVAVLEGCNNSKFDS